MRRQFLISVCATALFLCASGHAAHAALPKELRRELGEMSKAARGITGLIRRRKIDEAKAAIRALEARVAELNIEDNERDRAWILFRRHLAKAREAIPVSFESEIAPILSENCLGCHGPDRTSAKLRLNSFNGLRRGGRSGALLSPGNATASLIMGRLTVSDDRQRMPRGRERLSDTDLALIARWIEGGANFDGEDADAAIGSSAEPPRPKIKVAQADGSETVSFRQDVAPIFVTFCLRCHQGNTPRGGFSVVRITDILQGGETGSTVVPGNAEESYLWQLVGLQDPIKMPQGNSLLKRSQAQAIRTWINEGARFDGDDPAATLRSMVPTQADQQARRMTEMDDTEFQKRRVAQAATMWKRVAPRESAKSVATDHFIVHGNVPQERLQEVADLAEAQSARLADSYGSTGLWRGKLIIFLTHDRFEYTEFNTVLRDQRTPAGMHGHVVVTSQLADAWLACHDRSITAPEELTTNQLVSALIAEAWLIRDGSSLPGWLRQGFGVVECQAERRFLSRLKSQAKRAVSRLSAPTDVFDGAAMPATDERFVGAALTQFLLTQGKPKLMEFADALRSGTTIPVALTAVYGQSADAVAEAFGRNIGR